MYIRIDIENKANFSAFVEWMEEDGFERFQEWASAREWLQSEPDVMSTSDETDFGHHFEIE